MRAVYRHLPALTVTSALALTLAACGAPAKSGSTPASAATGSSAAAVSFPVSLNTANGTIRINSRPHAIISLSPTATEMLYAIGAGSQVKAVDADSTYPPQAPRTKLSGLQPNIEAIVAYKPDLVVVSNYASAIAPKLAKFGIPVLDLPAPSGISGVYSEFTQLGRATGDLAQAQREDASLRKQISAIVASVPHRPHPLTYYYELDPTYYSVTSATFIGRLLGLLGMKSIADAAKGAAAAGGYPQLSAEYILRANPGYILLADTVCCHQSAATVAKRPGWASLAAVKDGHIIPLNDTIASTWGPRIVDLLRAVAAGLTRTGGS